MLHPRSDRHTTSVAPRSPAKINRKPRRLEFTVSLTKQTLAPPINRDQTATPQNALFARRANITQAAAPHFQLSTVNFQLVRRARTTNHHSPITAHKSPFLPALLDTKGHFRLNNNSRNSFKTNGCANSYLIQTAQTHNVVFPTIRRPSSAAARTAFPALARDGYLSTIGPFHPPFALATLLDLFRATWETHGPQEFAGLSSRALAGRCGGPRNCACARNSCSPSSPSSRDSPPPRFGSSVTPPKNKCKNRSSRIRAIPYSPSRICAPNARSQLNRSAELFATLPAMKAMMADEKLRNIQDASEEIWRSGDAQLFALADWKGQILALHTVTPGFPRSAAQQMMSNATAPATTAAGGLARDIYTKSHRARFTWARHLRNCVWGLSWSGVKLIRAWRRCRADRAVPGRVPLWRSAGGEFPFDAGRRHGRKRADRLSNARKNSTWRTKPISPAP